MAELKHEYKLKSAGDCHPQASLPEAAIPGEDRQAQEQVLLFDFYFLISVKLFQPH